MEVKFKARFDKDLESIDDRNVLDAIYNSIQDVENASKPQDIKGIKKMKGDKTAFRIRIGRYRIGIYIINSVVEFAKEIKRQTHRKFTAEEKIRIVLEAMRGEETITAVCRKYAIHQNNYFKWSKEFIEAGKRR